MRLRSKEAETQAAESLKNQDKARQNTKDKIRISPVFQTWIVLKKAVNPFGFTAFIIKRLL